MEPGDGVQMTAGVASPVVLPESGQAIDARRKRLLKAVIKHVPWSTLVQIVVLYLPRKLYLPGKDYVEVLLRIHLMQRWFNLSDDEARFEELLQDIRSVPYLYVFSRLALLDKERIARIGPDMIDLKAAILKEKEKLWKKICRIIDDALEDQGLLLKREAEDAETVLAVSPDSPEEVAAKRRAREEAEARSGIFVPFRYWSFQARLLGRIIAFQYFVMLVAPRDVQTRFPLVGDFVRAMKWVCDLMIFPAAARENNTITYLGRVARHPELAQLLASLMIAMLPLYLYCCYRWLGFDRKRNYRHFVISPYNREVIKGNTAFIKDALSDEDQKELGISTQALPGKKRSLVGIFIWSLLLVILPLAACLMIFGFGQSKRSGVGDGVLLWMETALLHVGSGGFINTFFAVLGIQGVALFGSMVTAAFCCCWRDWFFFTCEKLTGCFFFIRNKLKGD
jgi:hypothetical protein